MTTVGLSHLTKRYDGSVEAVKDLTLDVPAGELVAFLGPSGCGKTTALKIIAGIARPTSGEVCFDNHPVTQIPPHSRGAAMVFQKPLLFPYMTVGDNVAFGLRMRSVSRAERTRRVKEMLELVHLPGFESRWPRQLSGGQEQRVSLARALIIKPRVLLLDEPLSQLDANLRAEMRELIVRIQRQTGITTIFVTHDQEEAVVMADRIALIFEGKLQQYDLPRGFYEQPKNVRVARFFGGINFVSGRREGTRVATGIGTFAVDDVPEPPHGPVLLTIRPEAIDLGPRELDNTVQGVVRSTVYMGTHTRYVIEANGVALHATADLRTVYREGDRITARLPRDRIWLFPVEV